MKWLASWIMDRIESQGSSDWAQAMRREFDELETGQLSWALGSLTTVVFADLRKNWFFLAALILGGWLFASAMSYLFFLLLKLDIKFARTHFYAINIFSPLLFPFLMGLWKPGRELTIGILGGFVSYGVGNAVFAAVKLGGTFTEWFFEAMWMDTLPVYLGSMVVAVLWAMAAWLGGMVHARRAGLHQA